MFSGIVEEMGAVSVLNKGLAGTRLTIIASTIMSDLTIGARLDRGTESHGVSAAT